MSHKVCIINSSYQYMMMFLDRCWEVVPDIESADLIVFTGGEDVSPKLYGEKNHRLTGNNPSRDALEEEVFKAVKGLGKPMIGICRGGQFLNVMNGGKMYQHVTKHTADHLMKVKSSGELILVSSTHHQMMRAGDEGIILATANQKGVKEYMHGEICLTQIAEEVDTEVVLYRDNKCICFQPHPEFNGNVYEPMRNYFFNLISKHFFTKD